MEVGKKFYQRQLVLELHTTAFLTLPIQPLSKTRCWTCSDLLWWFQWKKWVPLGRGRTREFQASSSPLSEAWRLIKGSFSILGKCLAFFCFPRAVPWESSFEWVILLWGIFLHLIEPLVFLFFSFENKSKERTYIFFSVKPGIPYSCNPEVPLKYFIKLSSPPPQKEKHSCVISLENMKKMSSLSLFQWEFMAILQN